MSIVKANEGEALNVLGDTVTVKLRASGSTRQLAVITVDVPPGSVVSPHIHRAEDESYFMLSGALRLTIGSIEYGVLPGDFVHIPAGTVHGYRNDAREPARFLAWTVGGPLDEFFREMNRRVRALPADAAALHDVLARYGISIVGQP